MKKTLLILLTAVMTTLPDASAALFQQRVSVVPVAEKISIERGTVFINGKPAGRVGDAINCGGSASAGSGNVFIGG